MTSTTPRYFTPFNCATRNCSQWKHPYSLHRELNFGCVIAVFDADSGTSSICNCWQIAIYAIPAIMFPAMASTDPISQWSRFTRRSPLSFGSAFVSYCFAPIEHTEPNCAWLLRAGCALVVFGAVRPLEQCWCRRWAKKRAIPHAPRAKRENSVDGDTRRKREH